VHLGYQRRSHRHEYRTKIKTYITENKVRPVQSKEKIVVGAKVPSDVELVAVPSD
jgi:hypothetical protein